MESIRLVIWELDETFWHGTLTEGGIRKYVQEHHDIVIELAKRGIISSICSKNEFAAVEKILQEQGIWDYFILPSIDWMPKGPRLKQLIADIMLRPESVLFIDDNASNRAEAAVHVPGLQVADESIISSLLNNELFKGKDDSSLTRLKQYQLLQRRKIDEKAAGDDNATFLQASNIRVVIEPNISAHLDRAIELINRTNQLNFTKNLLPDDKKLAEEELKKIANRYCNQSGLIRVWDNYGDYGFCGFYVVSTVYTYHRLTHLCFSCRILGMGVERWLYQQLGKPSISIKGDVQSDLFAEGNINWINQHVDGAIVFTEGNGNETLPSTEVMQSLIQEIRLKGGCELDALSHYLSQETKNLIRQTNYVNGAFLIRKDSINNLLLSFTNLEDKIIREVEELGFNATDFEDNFFTVTQPNILFVISTWGDLYLPTYRHNTLGFEITVALQAPGPGLEDLTKVADIHLENYFNKFSFPNEKREQVKRIIKHLSLNYSCSQILDQNKLRNHWTKIFNRVPNDCSLVVLLPNSRRGGATSLALQYHDIVHEVARNFPQISILDTTRYLTRIEDQQDAVDHLDRMVYFNIYKDILIEFAKKPAYSSTSTDKLVENPQLA